MDAIAWTLAIGRWPEIFLVSNQSTRLMHYATNGTNVIDVLVTTMTKHVHLNKENTNSKYLARGIKKGLNVLIERNTGLNWQDNTIHFDHSRCKYYSWTKVNPWKNSCERDLCECDKWSVDNLKKVINTTNPKYLAHKGFIAENECENIRAVPRADRGEIKCCGEYPHRFNHRTTIDWCWWM